MPDIYFKSWIVLLVAAICLPPSLCARTGSHLASSNDTSVLSLLNSGHANDAILSLQKILAANPQDALAHNLLCRVYDQEQRWTEAVKECQTAVQMQPGNSEFHLWLGRSIGQQAQRASLLTAPGLAKKVHAEFQTAVQLDPRNVAALCDLGKFFVDAPGFLGGGLDKAQAIARQLQPLNAEKYHWMLATIASKEDDPATAERELKLAVAQAKAPALAWMDMAAFYARRKNFPAMEQAIRNGMAADTNNDSALVDGASILIRRKQNLPLAEQLLRRYLASAHLSEEAPAFQVHALLGKLLARQGKTMAAQQEFAAAKALASVYSVGHT